MRPWFTIDHIDANTHIISEYRHWEQTHAYLLCGEERSLLIDTGLGICNISEEVKKLTDKPVTAVATHIHWDHIGGHRYYPDFYVHADELDWLRGGFPQTMEQIEGYVVERCDLPPDFSIEDYVFFQGEPTRILADGDWIDLGGRRVQALHTPGHSPGHLCFYEPAQGDLYTGDLIYRDTLTAWFPSTDPQAYLRSVERVAALPVQRIFPAHHSLDVVPTLLTDVQAAFRQLQSQGLLHHGSGTHAYKNFAIWL